MVLPFGQLKLYSGGWDNQNHHLLLTNSGLYLVTIPMDGRAEWIGARTILIARPDEYGAVAELSLRGWDPYDIGQIWDPKNIGRTVVMYALLRDDSVEFRDPDGALKFQAPVTRKNEWWMTVQVGAVQVGLGDTETVYVVQWENDTSGYVIASYHTDGRLLSRRTVPQPETTQDLSNGTALLAAQPGVMLIMAAVVEWTDVPDGAKARALALLAFTPLIVCTALGLAAALLVIVRHMRYQPFDRWQRWLWGIALFLFPFFVIPIYFSSPDLVPTVRCPNCGRQRPLASETCPWCAAPFPKRAPTGIELLSPTLPENRPVAT